MPSVKWGRRGESEPHFVLALFEFAVGLAFIYYSWNGRLIPLDLWLPDGVLFLLGGGLAATGEEDYATAVAVISTILFVVTFGITISHSPGG